MEVFKRRNFAMNNNTKLTLRLAAIAAFVCVAVPARAEQRRPKGVSEKDERSLQALIDAYRRQDPLKIIKLGDNLYLAKGGRGGNDANVGFAVGDAGVIFIDSKNSAESEKDVLDEIAKITPKTVNTAVILHSDHEKGVTALPTGLTIIAQENTKKEMEVSTARDAVPKSTFPLRPSPKTKP